MLIFKKVFDFLNFWDLIMKKGVYMYYHLVVN